MVILEGFLDVRVLFGHIDLSRKELHQEVRMVDDDFQPSCPTTRGC